MAYDLYEDQQEFVRKLRESLKTGRRSILGVASPAFGKTVVAAHITETARRKDPGATVWFVVHRKNLLRQTSASFWKAKIEHGLITSGKTRSTLPIQIGTIGTIHSRLAALRPPRILFVDEAHLSRGAMFSAVIGWALTSGAIVIGLTGTPIRLDGQSLGGLFQDLIEAKSTRWLIDQGRLSDYVAYTVPRLPDLSAIKATAGDFNIAELADAMDRPTITGDAVAHWRKHAHGLRTVCYCVNVAHSKHTAEAFNGAGIPAVHVDASSTEADIKDACEGLATRRYLVLCNCELVIEGFDLSAQVGRDVTLECCILLRPTQSLARYLQMVFRALRAKPQPAVILDHAGCIIKHGLPCEPRTWSLAGETKSKRTSNSDPDVNVQQCAHCYAIFRPGPDACPQCNSPIERKERKLTIGDGDLEQIDVAAMRKQERQEQGMARGLRALVSLGVRKGMNHPDRWAAHVFAARSNRKAVGADYNNARKILMEIKSNEQRNTVTTPDHAGAERAGAHGLA